MSEPAHVIVIEDDEGNRTTVTRALRKAGYDVSPFADAESALESMRTARRAILVVTDLMLPGTDGFGVLEAVRELDPESGLLMITGHGSVESAVEAMKRGADDYLTKPVDLFELRKRAAAIIDKRLLSRRVAELEARLGEKFKLIGRSRPMEALFRQMELVAPARSNVLIMAESGTGKELVANALHENSLRSDKRFLPINCAAIPSEILESELFGHERGSFTGATGRKIGKFELADGGTLFLDEIGELPIEMQVKLLRVLEQREFMRVGGSETIKVDIRLVAATNQDLEQQVEAGRFRRDLYYRLKVVTLSIPPLRDRREDIPMLASHFLELYARENGREGMRFATETMRALMAGRWEGNVRELRNVIESLVVLSPDSTIRPEDLAPEYRMTATDRSAAPAAARDGSVDGSSAAPPATGTVEGLTMDEIERQAILAALERSGGNRTQAADALGIGLRTLQRKLKEYRLAGKAQG